MNSLPATFQDYYFSLGSGSVSGTNATYYGTISVGSASAISSTASYYTNIVLVTIGITWTNNFCGTQTTHQRQMQTLVAYYGLVNYLYGPNFVQQE